MVIQRKTKSAATQSSQLTKTRSIKSYFSTPAPEQTSRTSTATATTSLQDRIEQRAYDFYERRGRMDGLDQFDWTVAETFVNLENAASRSRQTSSRMEKDLEGEIQKKAYELYEKRGYAHGNDQFDWLLARELVYLENKIRP